MQSPEEQAKQAIKKKFKISEHEWTDCHTSWVDGYDKAVEDITELLNTHHPDICQWFKDRVLSQLRDQ